MNLPIEREKLKRELTAEFSDSEISGNDNISDICDDDELDDVDISFLPPSLEKPAKPTEIRYVASVWKRARTKNYVWFRCVICSAWNHAECSGVNTPENYKFEFCLV